MIFKTGELVKFEYDNKLALIIDVRDNPPDLKWKPVNLQKGDVWPRKIIDIYFEGEISTVWLSRCGLIKCE